MWQIKLIFLSFPLFFPCHFLVIYFVPFLFNCFCYPYSCTVFFHFLSFISPLSFYFLFRVFLLFLSFLWIILIIFLFPVIFYPFTFSFPLLSLFLFSFPAWHPFLFCFLIPFLPIFFVSFLCNLFSFYYFFSYSFLSFVSMCLHLTSFLSWASSIFFSFFLSFFPCFVCSCPVLFPFLNLTWLSFPLCPVLSLVLFSPVLYFPSWLYSSRSLIVLIAATSDHVSSKCLPQSTCVWMQCTGKKTSRTNTPPIWNAGLD